MPRSVFATWQTERNLLSDATPSVQHVEVFDVPDLDGFTAEDMPGETVQRIMGDFSSAPKRPSSSSRRPSSSAVHRGRGAAARLLHSPVPKHSPPP